MAAVIRRRTFGVKRTGRLDQYVRLAGEPAPAVDRAAQARQALPGVPRGVWLASWTVARKLDQFQVPASASAYETRQAIELIYGDRAGKTVYRADFIEQVLAHRRLADPGPVCAACRQPLNPAVVKLGYEQHYLCEYPRSCDCATPWDDQARPGGVHCVGCHSNFGSYEVFMKHRPYADDGCISLHHVTGVDGQTLFALYWSGEFRVWQRSNQRRSK